MLTHVTTALDLMNAGVPTDLVFQLKDIDLQQVLTSEVLRVIREVEKEVEGFSIEGQRLVAPRKAPLGAIDLVLLKSDQTICNQGHGPDKTQSRRSCGGLGDAILDVVEELDERMDTILRLYGIETSQV